MILWAQCTFDVWAARAVAFCAQPAPRGPDAPDVYADAMEKIAEMRVPKFVEPSSRCSSLPYHYQQVA
eukprot:4346371-Amphidinium_carterae.1